MKYLSIFVIMIAFCLCGCDEQNSGTAKTDDSLVGRVNDLTRSLPPGSTVTIDTDESIGSAMLKQEGSAAGTGAGLYGGGDEVAQNFDGSSPGATLFGIGGATGGSTSVKTTILGGSAASPLMWAGILCMLGVAVAIYFRNRRAAMSCGIVGVALIAAALTPPIVMALIVGAAVILLVCFYLFAERGVSKGTELNRSLAWFLNSLPPDLKAQVMPYLDAQMEKNGPIDDKKTLAAIQAKEGII